MHRKSNPLGLIYFIIGLVLFIVVAGEFLVRLILALVALWLIFYGLQLWQGGKTNMFFGRLKNWRDL